MHMRIRRFIPCMILFCIVALHGVARHENLSPWSGGGLAMFSTLDRLLHRGVEVQANGRRIPIPDRCHNLALHARAWPSDDALHILGRAVAPTGEYQVQAYTLRYTFSPLHIRVSRERVNQVEFTP